MVTAVNSKLVTVHVLCGLSSFADFHGSLKRELGTHSASPFSGVIHALFMARDPALISKQPGEHGAAQSLGALRCKDGKEPLLVRDHIAE